MDLLDAGDVEVLRAHLNAHPALIGQRVLFEGGNYFRNPTLLAFIADNPIRRGNLPATRADYWRVPALKSDTRHSRWQHSLACGDCPFTGGCR